MLNFSNFITYTNRLKKFLHKTSSRNGSINDPEIIKYYGGQALSEYLLRLKEKECAKLSEIFLKCAEKTEGYHAYLTVSTLPDIKVLVSVNEYGDEVLSSN